MTSMNQVSSFGASEKRRTVRQIDCFAGRLDCQAAAAFAAYPNWWPASTSSFSITTLTAAPSPRPLLHSILENLARLVHVFPGHNASQAVGPLASWRLTLIEDPGNGAKEASLQTQATFSNRFLRPAAGDGVGAHR
jgi:hypothetical protein